MSVMPAHTRNNLSTLFINNLQSGFVYCLFIQVVYSYNYITIRTRLNIQTLIYIKIYRLLLSTKRITWAF